MRNNDERSGAKKAHQGSPPLQTGPPRPPVNAASAPSFPLDFVNPTTFVALPSKGALYPAGHSLSGVAEVEIRQMTAKQEDILTSPTLLKKGVAIDRFVQSLMVDSTINVNDLLVGDKNAILIAARVEGYGAQYTTAVICPSCSERAEYEFDLAAYQNELEEEASPESLPENITVNDTGHYVVSLEMGWDVEIKPLTSSDEKKIAKTLEQRKKAKMVESVISEQLRAMIVSISGHTDRAVINKAINMMPVKSSRALRDAYSAVVPNVDLKRDFNCPHCGTDTRMEVPLSAEFFWPRQ